MNPYTSAYKKNAAERKVKDRRSFFSVSVIVVFFLLGVSFLLVYKQAIGQQMLIESRELSITQKDLGTEKSVLLGEKQALLSRARIVSYARDRLKLEFPSPNSIRWIRVETVK